MGEGAIRPRLGSYAWEVGPPQSVVLCVQDPADWTSVDSLAGMKNALPGLRKRLNTDPVYFKQVYMHTFDLAKPEGARTLPIDSGELHHHPQGNLASG